MKLKKSTLKSAAKAGQTAAIYKASKAKPSAAFKRGPQPERLKIDGNWEDAAARLIRKPKPKEGWPKR